MANQEEIVEVPMDEIQLVIAEEILEETPENQPEEFSEEVKNLLNIKDIRDFGKILDYMVIIKKENIRSRNEQLTAEEKMDKSLAKDYFDPEGLILTMPDDIFRTIFNRFYSEE